MNGVLTSTLDNFVKSTSITGNAIIDSIIFSTLIAAILNYINGLTMSFKYIGEYIFTFIKDYLMDKIKTRFIGKILCSIEISNDNKLFNVIKQLAFNSNIKSDVDNNIINKLYNLSKEKNSINKETICHYDKFNINVDYSDENLFVWNKSYNLNDIDTTIFKYKEYYVRVILQSDITKTQSALDTGNKPINEVHEKLTIELICRGNHHKFVKDCDFSKELDNFLKEKFKIDDHITYTYTVNIDNFIIGKHILNFMTNFNKTANSGLLAYGDGVFTSSEKLENKLICNQLTVNLEYNNFNVENIKDKISLSGNVNIDSPINTGGFVGIYRRFINKTFPGDVVNYGYYINDNKIILLSKTSTGIVINIISNRKILNTNDIKDIIVYIIKNGMSRIQSKNKIPTNAYKYSNNVWIKYQLEDRTFDSVFIRGELMLQLKKEINTFIKKENLFKACKIPYKRGILFYGPPGTGKTSLVKAIAYEYQMDVYLINVNDSTVDDDSIIDMINAISNTDSYKMILFEDIDSLFADKEKIKIEERTSSDNSMKNNLENGSNMNKKFLTYSGLINALDGLISNQNRILTVMTTNKLDKLGDALIRPGRIDTKYYLGACNYTQIYEMTKFIISKNKLDDIVNQKSVINEIEEKTYDDDDDDDEINEKIKKFASKLVDSQNMSKILPCQLQKYLVNNIDDLDSLFNNYQQLL